MQLTKRAASRMPSATGLEQSMVNFWLAGATAVFFYYHAKRTMPYE
jgi:hypothetical protein